MTEILHLCFDPTMQDVADGQEPSQIPVLPEVPEQALANLKQSFEYITDWILPSGVRNSLSDASEDDALDYTCSCEDMPCNDKNIECTCVIDYGHYYNSEGQLMLDELPEHHTLYECSPECACHHTSRKVACPNAVTQGGVGTRISVRWTEDRGFGLFAEEDIAKGSFLCCYVGEVISTTEAKRRWRAQVDNGYSNYILVLKEETNIKGQKQILKTTIDARTRGNLGHFLNHACPPLTTHVVIPVRTVGTLIPRPAFFAARDIKAGEELTWDYEDAGGETWLFHENAYQSPAFPDHAEMVRTPCHCGSPKCRKWLAYDPSL
ncbi:SET domain-containing protein [Cystobasidium minutum MCA 4210]|uniref:SET domain-containing protein n=1 Tax=Cystobasidium minutum MCA 4210 TaxID=1397322 RepID=UPI0034CE2DB7|eukprot:jgi/Rhomi1/186897/estExt_fgenesh1_pg.C_1_t10136